MDHPVVLGVKITDSTQFTAIQAELAALANKHGLEVVQVDSNSRDEIDELKRHLEATLAEVERCKTSFGLLAGMSHDLRTHQSTIVGYAELFLEQMKEKSDIELKEEIRFIGKIRDAGKQLHGLVHDLIDFTKIESGKFALSLGNYNVVDLVNEAVYLADSQFHFRQTPVEFVVSDTSNLGKINIDEWRFRQVLSSSLEIAGSSSSDARVTLEITQQALNGQVALLFRIHTRCNDKHRLEWAFERGIEWPLVERLCKVLGGSVNKTDDDNILQINLVLPTNLS
jgi:K+-sensing histidine kinase KdpD